MIKVTLSEKPKEENEKPFPKLMTRRDQNLIILFSEPDKGIVLNGGTSPYSTYESVSHLGGQWFTDYNEPITLQND